MQLHTHKLLKNLDLVRVIDSAQPQARHPPLVELTCRVVSKLWTQWRLSPADFVDFVLGHEPIESLPSPRHACCLVVLCGIGTPRLSNLYRSYIESDPSHGLHILFEESHGHRGGQQRVESSCVSLAALVRGDLEAGQSGLDSKNGSLSSTPGKAFQGIRPPAAR